MKKPDIFEILKLLAEAKAERDKILIEALAHSEVGKTKEAEELKRQAELIDRRIEELAVEVRVRPARPDR